MRQIPAEDRDQTTATDLVFGIDPPDFGAVDHDRISVAGFIFWPNQIGRPRRQARWQGDRSLETVQELNPRWSLNGVTDGRLSVD